MSACRGGLLTAALLAAMAPGACRAAPVGGLLLRLEAENWSAQGGGALRVIDRPEASGGRTVSYWEEPGPWLELAFETREAADVLISLGYALAWPEARRRVLVDGRPVGEAVLADTGSWGTFAVATLPFAPLPLAPGRHVVRIDRQAAGRLPATPLLPCPYRPAGTPG